MSSAISENQNVIVTRELGRIKTTIKVSDDKPAMVSLPIGVWNYGAIVSALVRSKYSEDAVEAIINNNIALMAMPSTIDEEDGQQKLSEFQEMQQWREKCKARAKELLALGKEMGLEESYG